MTVWCCALGELETVQSLVGKGIDVNAKDNNGETALMKASAGGHIETVEFLISKERMFMLLKTTMDGMH